MLQLKNKAPQATPRFMIEPRRILSARALLGMLQKELGGEVRDGGSNDRRHRDGRIRPSVERAAEIQEVLEAEGIVFLNNGPGVRLRPGR